MGSWPPQGFFPTSSVRPVVNVLDFGADPTGTVDSTTAIQNAWATIPTTGGISYFPTGTYLSIGGLTRTNPTNFTIRGDGKGSVIKAHANTQNLLTLGASGATFEEATVTDIKLDGSASGQVFIGLHAFNARHSVFRAIEAIANTASSGLVIESTGVLGGFNNDFISCETRTCKFGINFIGLGAAQLNSQCVYGGSINGDGSLPAGGIGIHHAQGASLSIYGTDISSFETILKLDSGSIKGQFYGMAMEGFTTGVNIVATANNNAFYGGGRTDSSTTVVTNAGSNNNFYHFNGFDVGPPTMLGVDNRSGLVAADGAPITLYAVPAGAGQLFRISADIFATVVSAGTANYTITWTENAQAKTMVVSASVVNTLATATDLINADASTSITAQLTFAGFTGTVKVASVVEQLA